VKHESHADVAGGGHLPVQTCVRIDCGLLTQ